MFEPLKPLRYTGIIADPPWSFQTYSEAGQGKSADAHYKTMSLARLGLMRVDHLAAPGCLLFMWATWPMLPTALRLMDSWRFTYKTGGAWHKKTKHGKSAFGTGYIFRSASEPFLIGTIGDARFNRTTQARSVRNIIEAAVQEHSRKPDQAHEMVEALVPGPYCEIFARRHRPGWECWGDQLEPAA